jgi:exosortase
MEYSPLTVNSARIRDIGVAPTPSEVGKLSAGLGLFALALCWLLVFNALRVDWTINPQYYYGWFVPVLALGLFRLRWITRPAPAPSKAIQASGLLAALALGILLPVRLVEEANPEWRLVLWAHALDVSVLTFCFLHYAGGWRWARHFAFPVLFLLVAVPWPVPFEQNVVQGLMRFVAAITVEAVGLLNIPAVQHGNIIQISSGLVGVDEACSGVRSLQVAFFICLFLGELYRISIGRRIWLLVSGVLVALFCNVARTFFLVWSASRHGLEGMHATHDAAGQVALVAALVAIWVVARMLGHKRPAGNPAPALIQTRARVVPNRVVFGALAWVLLSELTTQAWYSAHESKAVLNPHWSVSWPESQYKAEKVPIDPSVAAMLRCSTGEAEDWQDDAGNRWRAFFFRWAPGRNSAQLASAHTPDICLRGVGYKLTSDIGLRTVSAGDLKLPFRQYIFSHGQAPLHVFYCRWEDHPNDPGRDLQEDGTELSRLRAVLAGRRHLGQQVLEVTVSGPDTPEEAFAALETQIRQIIRR